MANTTTRKKKALRKKKGLLDEAAVVSTLIDSGVLVCQDDAVKFARRLIHQVFRYEVLTIHRRLAELRKSTPETILVQDKPTAIQENSLDEFDATNCKSLAKRYTHVFAGWRVLTSKVVQISESSDYVTTKLLIELESGNQIESVILRHQKRTTLCISSQVGCKMKCTFCATGTLGERENCTSGEIQEQVLHANRFLQTCKEPRSVTNIVFMGMGEPLNNYKAVIGACRALTSQERFSLSPGKVTVSTVGVVNRMKTLLDDAPGVSLALSLHAPNQTLRQKIIPTASAYPIPKLMAGIDDYLAARKKLYPKKEPFVMIEYILLSGVNDTPEVAQELAELLQPIRNQVKVNLIPYNPIFNAEGLAKTFLPPTETDIETFKDIIQNRNGIFCTVRTEMGQDVNGACGQLACISERKKGGDIVDIEDLYQNRVENQLYSESGENVFRKKKTSTSEVLQSSGPMFISGIIVVASIAALSYILMTRRN